MGHCRRDCCGGNTSFARLIAKCKLGYNLQIIFFSLVLYGANQFYLKKTVNIPLVAFLLKNYFNDWLCGVLLVAYINVIIARSRYKTYQIRTVSSAVFVNTLCGIVWEFGIPSIIQRGTSDWYDIVSYITGGIAYIFIQNKAQKYTY